MNRMVIAWMAIAALLSLRSFVRPSYAVGLYMLTFFAAPSFWWWGDIIEGYRWNLFAGILLLLTLLMTKGQDPMEREGPLSTNAVRILGWMAANIVLVHLVLAINPAVSLGWVIARFKFILLFFMLQYAIRDRRDYIIVVMAMTLGMGYLGYEVTINDRGSFSGGRLEGVGAAGVQSSNQLASLFITCLPISVTLLFTEASWKTKAAVVVLIALAFNVVLLCNSRGAFLGLLAGGAVFMYMASGPARKYSRRILVASGLATFLLLGDPEILARFMTTFTEEGQQDNSAQSRIRFWNAAGRMALDYPFGSGGNSFSEGRGWRYLRGVEYAPDTAGDTRAIHNGFLTELTDWGIQGFALMIAFIVGTWRTMRRGRRLGIQARDGVPVVVHACLAAGMVGWLVSSLFGDYLNNEWGFWVTAMAYSYLRLQVTDARTETATATEPHGGPAASLSPAWESAGR